MINYPQTAHLLSYLREMTADTNNTPDLELACDFIEITYPEVDLTPAVIEQVEDILTFTLA